MLAIAVSGLAGYSKEHEISSEDRAEAGERDFSFVKGLAVAIFAGIMSSCFAYGLAAGKPIAEIARVRAHCPASAGSLAEPSRPDRRSLGRLLLPISFGRFFSSSRIVPSPSSRERQGINPMGATDGGCRTG